LAEGNASKTVALGETSTPLIAAGLIRGALCINAKFEAG
jgi:hypothetical protein